ncbi:MAG TPA: hypothetical protein VEC36_00225 [Patescibacteria group bacterium]|nr:hypothetical protein [Patescibacteria group bacterium]
MNTKLKKYITGASLAFAFSTMNAVAQTPGDEPTRGDRPRPNSDSTIIFRSPRPLIDPLEAEKRRSSMGIMGTLSSSGFGAGGFYQKEFTKDWTYTIDGILSGARNTDELETGFDPYTGMTFIPNKVNRIYMLPLMAGIQHRLFSDKLTDNLRPFVSAGAGPAFILTTPYQYEFFRAFADGKLYTRVGGFVGAGAQVGTPGLKSTTSVSARYYFIPFGGEGLESIKGSPINDFGGLQLSVSVGL